MIDQNKLNDVLSYVNRYNEENGFPPTVRDICGALGIKSTATAYSYINRLREAGLLNKADGKKRAVALVGSDTVKVPLVGTVTAGQPILAVENYESFYALPSAEFHGDGLFLLRVRGESMIDAGIYEGDILIIDRSIEPRRGDIVLAYLQGDFTLKKLEFVDGKPELHPQNSSGNYPVIHPGEYDDFQIEGVLVGSGRKYRS